MSCDNVQLTAFCQPLDWAGASANASLEALRRGACECRETLAAADKPTLAFRPAGDITNISFTLFSSYLPSPSVSPMDRASKRRQVKPLAASLLDVLDYDSSDDSDFEVGDADASGSEGTGNGSDDEGSKDSAGGADSDSDVGVSPEDEGIDDEDSKELKEEMQEDEKAKDQPCSDESSKKETVSKNRKKAEKNSETEPNGSSTVEESPKKKKAGKNTSTFDEEETNDSHSTSQGKGNEDSLVERTPLWTSQRMEHILICCVCLGDNSEDTDEIIQCDNCGVTVHEGCYGVDGESDSIMSSASENSTEPWFCDACKNGVMPSCELCPSQDGIFKETDAGRWVHVVCALYVPGVAFGDIDKLRPVTLTEMNYTKYGAKECSLCEDARFARTGVCISCDAGMCRSYFHVTCAQREGLLSEAAAEEDIADPFFAYCKQHADRFDRKWKRKNYLALQSYCKVSLHEREKQLTPEAQVSFNAYGLKARISARLQQYRAKAEVSRNARPQAWVPREKLPRPLTSSASAVRKLLRKAELMGISTDVFATDTADANASLDGRRKHKQPALTADFVNYYLERNMRMIQIQDNILEQKNLKDKLESEQEKLHVEYNKLCESLEDLQNVNGLLRTEGQSMWSMLGNLLGQKLNAPAILKPPKERKPSKKEGGSPGKSCSLPAVLYSCGICKKNQDQHLLLLCDTCKLHYHLGCLDPPLTRMPKKTKNSYWQCSECDQASSDEADIAMETLPDGTKRSRRQIKGPIKFIPQDMSPEPKKLQLRGTHLFSAAAAEPIPTFAFLMPFNTAPEQRKALEPAPRERRQRQSVLQKKPKADDTRTECTTCKGPGDNENLVRCDECQLCYHFGCLDPPLKKSPKQTGYGWICQECDTSSSKEEEEVRKAEEDGVKEEMDEQNDTPN
ncbi:PHD finger protein 14 [Bagarius yarrelli]|uniref:PHD finger protein 14 n=1 Tax=Bagarius yarrelli TaxID=175774 RepID=A0A556TNU7_BAGYA|nr:PHD finger protein 14 [Bagarius yarrelli]